MEILKKEFKGNAVLIRGYYVGVLIAKDPEVIDFSNGKVSLISRETIQLYHWGKLKIGNINEIPDLKKLEGQFILNRQPTFIMEGYQYTIITDELYKYILSQVVNK